MRNIQNNDDFCDDHLKEHANTENKRSFFNLKQFVFGIICSIVFFWFMRNSSFPYNNLHKRENFHLERNLAAVSNNPLGIGGDQVADNDSQKADNFSKDLKLPLIWEPLRENIEYKKQENGIEVVLIKDPKAKNTQICFSINTGSWDEILLQSGKDKVSHGVAHLTEHAMFLGMKPDEKTMMSIWNAQTHQKNTYYMAQVASANVLNAIEQFYRNIGDFTKREDIYDETNAVNNEYRIDVKMLPWIIELAEQNILYDQKHPASWFAIGNFKTLKHKGIQDEVFRFYKEFYTTKKMNIVVIGNSDQDDFMSSIENVLNKPRKSLSNKPRKKELTYTAPLFQEEKIPSILFIASKGISMIKIQFGFKMNDVQRQDFESHMNFVADYLKKLIAYKISEENYYGFDQDIHLESFDNVTLKMDLNFALTEFGKKNIANILKVVDTCIRMTKKYLISDYNKKLYQNISDVRFLLSQSPFMFVFSQFLSQNVAYYGAENLFSGNFGLVEKFDESIIQNIFEQLSSEKMSVVYVDNFDIDSSLKKIKDQSVASKKVFKKYDLADILVGKDQSQVLTLTKDSKNQSDKKDPNKIILDQYIIEHGIFYHSQQFEPEFIKNLTKTRLLEKPPKLNNNKFLPRKSQLDYIKKFKKVYEEKDNNFQKIFDNQDNFWYKEVKHFNQPIVAVTLVFDTKDYVFDLEKKSKIGLKKWERQAFNRIIQNFWMLRINSLKIDLQEINVKHKVFYMNGKIKIQLTMPEYSFEKVISSVFEKISVTGQDVQKDKVSMLQLTEAENTTVKETKYPMNFANALKQKFSCFIIKSCNNEDKHLKFLKSEKYQKIKLLFEKPRLVFGVVLGSIELKKIKQTFGKIKNDFSILKDDEQERKLTNFGSNYLPIYRKVNKMGSMGLSNSFYSTAFEIEDITPESMSIVKMLSIFLHNEAFTYLRQIKQLGYNVHVFSRMVNNKMILQLQVIGSQIKKIEQEAEVFFGMVEKKIKNITQATFDQLRKNVSHLYKDEWNSIDEEMKFYSDLLWNAKQLVQDYDVKNEMPKILEKMEASKLYDYFVNVVKKSRRVVFEFLPRELKLDGTKISAKNNFQKQEVKFFQ